MTTVLPRSEGSASDELHAAPRRRRRQHGDRPVTTVMPRSEREKPSMIARMRRLTPIVALGVVLAGCAEDAPQDTWQPEGENAQKIQDLQWWVFAIAGIVLVVVFLCVSYCVVRFRDRGQPMPEQSHGNPLIEVGLAGLAALILVIVAVPTVGTLMALAKEDDTECVVNVTGQQWWWEVDYPAGDCGGVDIPRAIVTSGQLVIPEDTDVLMRGTSRDVIHSFWVPKINGKKDVVPGRIHTLRLEADAPGIYAGQCAEFCGLSHANMRMEIVALDQDDFRSWVDNQVAPYEKPAAGSLAAEGESIFISQCARCHQVDGLEDAEGDPVLAHPEDQVYAGTAPNLGHLMSRNTFAGASWDLLTPECRPSVWEADPEEFGERYLAGVTEECLNDVDLREWLRDAPGKKPMYADLEQLEATDGLPRGMPDLGLSEDQIDALLAYLLELD